MCVDCGRIKPIGGGIIGGGGILGVEDEDFLNLLGYIPVVPNIESAYILMTNQGWDNGKI